MLSKDFIEEYMSKFRASHKGLKDLKIKVFSSMEDAFPLVPKKERDEKALAGAYYPASNIVLIIAENNKNIQQLHATIRHEIFGHLAINRLNEVDKYDLLQTIADASSDTWVGKYRDYLAMTSYKVLKDEPLMLAEEVVAHTAELSFNDIGRYESIPDPTMVESKEDLLGVIDALKNGIHHGVLEQKVFPAGDLAQFKVHNKEESMKKVQYIEYTPLVDKPFNTPDGIEWDYQTRQEDWWNGAGGESDALDDNIRAYDFEVHEIIDNEDKIVFKERMEVEKYRDRNREKSYTIDKIELEVKLQKIEKEFPDAKYSFDGHLLVSSEEDLSLLIKHNFNDIGEISKATKERIIAYGSLMDDKALIEAVESEDKEDLVALGDYFQELSQNEYLDYESFDSNQLQEMR